MSNFVAQLLIASLQGVLIGVWAIEIVGVFLLALGVGLKLSKVRRLSDILS